MQTHKQITILVLLTLSYYASAQVPTSKSVTDTVVCDIILYWGGGIQWNGNNYTSEGTFQVKLINSLGGDSIATLNIYAIHTTHVWEYDTIYDFQLPYIWRGKTINQSGYLIDTVFHDGMYVDSIYFKHDNSGGSCYSSTTLELTVLSSNPEYYYDSAQNLTGEQLKSALHDIIKDHKEFPYTSSSTDTWDILKETDKDTANNENVILFYSGWSVNAAQEYNNAQGWSREHVWAKSHGDFGTYLGAGTDVHHLRPTDITVNSARGNDDFDNGGTIYVDGDGTTECRTDYDSWEARGAVKGDVARMLFYMAVRYEGEGDEPDLELVDAVNTFDLNETGKGYHGKLSTLLEWHSEDPVDSFEINRNNVIYSYQLNRNPFIDHPEYVALIWDIGTGVTNLNEDKIKVFPNPAKNVINIDLATGTGTFTLYTPTGEVIFNTRIFDNFSLSTDKIKSGLYYYQFVTDDSELIRGKQIILK